MLAIACNVISGGYGKAVFKVFSKINFRRCLTLAACYQLAQSVLTLKIGFALAKEVG